MSKYPEYNIRLGTIITIDPYTHTYLVQDYLQQIDPKNGSWALPTVRAIPIGARGNTLSGVQFQESYQIGDTVLYIRETSGEKSTLLGFILGVVTPALMDVNSTETRVAATTWDGQNLNSSLFQLFDQLEQTAGVSRVPTNVGHTGIDMLPGSYEIVGKLVAFNFSDYYASLRATCAEISVNGIERRLVLQSMLRTESTVNTLTDTAILNQSTIDTKKWCGNVRAAWYDCLKEDKEQLTIIEDAKPQYRLVEQSGDILYGKHTTLLDQGGKTPLYTEYLGLDGTKKLLSASRLVIGKYPGVTATEYVGKRLAVESHDDEDPSPENLANPLENLDTKDEEVWTTYANTEFIENGGYPEGFLDTDEGEYPDFDEVTLKDDLREEKEIKLFTGNSYIEFQDDGSIKLTDAWGSFILLSHGNIELHAVNNLFAVSGRDTLCFAGGNRTDFAKQNIEAQAFKGSYKVASKESLQICSEGSLTVESRKKLYITASASEIASLNVTCRCINPLEPESKASGNFQVISENGSIDFIGRQFRSNALYISLTSDKLNQAFVLGGRTPLVVGNLDVRGGIWSSGENIKLTVPRQETDKTLADKLFVAPASTNWINSAGDIIATSGRLRVKEGVFTTGNICGKTVCDTRGGRKKYVGNASASSLSTLCTTSLPLNSVSSQDITISSAPNRSEYEFTFNIEGGAVALYRLVNPVPERNGNTEAYNGLKTLSKNVSFIYPGEDFWTVNGIADFTDIDEEGEPKVYGFAKVPTANIR